MILVLETNGGLLYLFQDAAEAEAQLEAIDIQNREYEFCDNTGQRFVGELTAPIGIFRSGSFRLRPDGVPDQANVVSVLSRARSLDRQCAGVSTLDDLRGSHVA